MSDRSISLGQYPGKQLSMQDADEIITFRVYLIGQRVYVLAAGQKEAKEVSNAIRLIDQLWKKYSNDRFGFSVQLGIYQSLGGNMDTLIAQNMEFLYSLGERIGWRKNKKWVEYDHFDFSVPPPVGALPGEWWHSPYGEKMANFFFAHLIRCEL